MKEENHSILHRKKQVSPLTLESAWHSFSGSVVPPVTHPLSGKISGQHLYKKTEFYSVSPSDPLLREVLSEVNLT